MSNHSDWITIIRFELVRLQMMLHYAVSHSATKVYRQGAHLLCLFAITSACFLCDCFCRLYHVHKGNEDSGIVLLGRLDWLHLIIAFPKVGHKINSSKQTYVSLHNEAVNCGKTETQADYAVFSSWLKNRPLHRRETGSHRQPVVHLEGRAGTMPKRHWYTDIRPFQRLWTLKSLHSEK